MIGLVISSTGVLIYCFALSYFDYIKAVESSRYVQFDAETITAADYTIEFDMPAESHKHFLKTYYNPANPMSELA